MRGSGPDSRFFLVLGSDPDFLEEVGMARTIIIQAEEPVACPKCNHRFQLTEGISRQAIERHAAELERSLAEHKKKLEAQIAAEARAQFEIQLKALNEALGAKDGSLARFRAEELVLRKQLRE